MGAKRRDYGQKFEAVDVRGCFGNRFTGGIGAFGKTAEKWPVVANTDGSITTAARKADAAPTLPGAPSV